MKSVLKSSVQNGSTITAGDNDDFTENFNINDFNIIKEGRAEIVTPKENKVFYNPVQQFNRDLSIMAIKSYIDIRQQDWLKKQESKEKPKELQHPLLIEQHDSATPMTKRQKLCGPGKIKILEALSASGLRAIRYGREIANVSDIVANDMSIEAIKSINRNIRYNKLQNMIRSNMDDAIKFMGLTDEKFHIVDLDPYGTAAPFIDSAIQVIENDGLLLVTCTDAGVLAGTGYPEKCFLLYGGNNFSGAFINSEANHEAGIRLILNLISSTAAKYLKAIVPELSLSIDFYFRVFVRVKASAIQVKKLSSLTLLVYGCIGCGHKVLQPLGLMLESTSGKGQKFQYPRVPVELPGSHCAFCESGYNVAGPMWLGPIHNARFIDKVLENTMQCDRNVYGTAERIKGMLTVAKLELEIDQPFYYNLNHLCSVFKSHPMSINEAARALGSKGYKVSLTHTKPNCIKTDAPWEYILRINWLWLVKSNLKYIRDMQNRSEDTSLGNTLKKVAAKIELLKQNINMSPNLTESSVGYRILKRYTNEQLPTEDLLLFDIDNDYSIKLDRLRRVKMVRYQENPSKYWGPKLRPMS